VNKQRAFLWLTIVAILMGMMACGPKEVELPFETITKGVNLGWKEMYWDYAPMLMTAVCEEDLARVGEYVLSSAQSPERGSLTEVDLKEYFVVAAFQGRTGHHGYSIEVVEAKQTGSTIWITAQLTLPPTGVPRPQEVNSPYHVIKIEKSKMSKRGELEFVLVDTEGKELYRAIYTVP